MTSVTSPNEGAAVESDGADIIIVKRLSDYTECDLCGVSYADGYRVWLNGSVILELEPAAHCYDGADYDSNDLLKKLVELLTKKKYNWEFDDNGG